MLYDLDFLLRRGELILEIRTTSLNVVRLVSLRVKVVRPEARVRPEEAARTPARTISGTIVHKAGESTKVCAPRVLPALGCLQCAFLKSFVLCANFKQSLCQLGIPARTWMSLGPRMDGTVPQMGLAHCMSAPHSSSWEEDAGV